MNEFKVGDVVQLKSGGPKMVVITIWENGQISCLWASEFGSFDKAFRPEFLVKESGS